MKLLLVLLLASGLKAESIEFPDSDARAMREPAQRLAKMLAASKPLYLGAGNLVPRKPGGTWNVAALQQAVTGLGAFDSSAPEGSWVRRSNPLRVLLIENKSTVQPLSKQFPAWGWPFQVVEFEQVEKAPRVWLDSKAWDAVIFSSPGWWDNFSNPPSGPSRLKETVAEAVRVYSKGGGTAVFVDLAQWDLEACWPKSIRLSSLGPWRLDSFVAADASEGKLALAPEGVVADRIFSKTRAVLFEQPSFPYTDGSIAQAYAAYAFPDPGGGSGIVAGYAFHVFDQDDSFAHRARRSLMNLLFVSGAGRISASGDVAAAAEPLESPSSTASQTPVATARPTEAATQAAPDTFSPTPSFTAVPATEAPTALPATAVPTATPVPTEAVKPTSVPTLLPTRLPTPVPTLMPTQLPTPMATLVPTRLPTLAPTRQPTRLPAQATALPTMPATPLPQARRTETAQPTAVPVRVRDAIGCLQSAPEPFSEGGVYVFYCLKHAATITFKVFNDKGKELYRADPKFKTTGTHQEFYGGVDQKGGPIKPGRYIYRLEAVYDERSSEWRQADFNLKRKKR